MRAYYSTHKHVRLFVLRTPEGWHVGLYDIQQRKWTDLDNSVPRCASGIRVLGVQELPGTA
jgi:hypothetical protein